MRIIRKYNTNFTYFNNKHHCSTAELKIVLLVLLTVSHTNVILMNDERSEESKRAYKQRSYKI